MKEWFRMAESQYFPQRFPSLHHIQSLCGLWPEGVVRKMTSISEVFYIFFPLLVHPLLEAPCFVDKCLRSSPVIRLSWRKLVLLPKETLSHSSCCCRCLVVMSESVKCSDQMCLSPTPNTTGVDFTVKCFLKINNKVLHKEYRCTGTRWLFREKPFLHFSL